MADPAKPELTMILYVWLTPIAAGIGAILGIFNAITNWRRDRIKLEIIPMSYGSARDGGVVAWHYHDSDWISKNVVTQPKLAIQVRNLRRAVTIEAVGFVGSRHILRRKRNQNLLTLTDPKLRGGGELPKRLEREESLIAYADLTIDEVSNQLGKARFAYAETSSGKFSYGTSEEFRLLCREARHAPNVASTVS
jgi:hypothetical protein